MQKNEFFRLVKNRVVKIKNIRLVQKYILSYRQSLGYNIKLSVRASERAGKRVKVKGPKIFVYEHAGGGWIKNFGPHFVNQTVGYFSLFYRTVLWPTFNFEINTLLATI